MLWMPFVSHLWMVSSCGSQGQGCLSSLMWNVLCISLNILNKHAPPPPMAPQPLPLHEFCPVIPSPPNSQQSMRTSWADELYPPSL